MSFLRYRAPSLLDDFRQEINELYNNQLASLKRNGDDMQLLTEGQWLPAVDIREEEGRYLVKADLPGVEGKDVEVFIDENNRLIIKGEKHHEVKQDGKEGFLRLERSHGSFYRAFALPETIDREGVSAKVQHGLLEVILPKQERSSSRKIPIED
jgi:HSP20 family protein